VKNSGANVSELTASTTALPGPVSRPSRGPLNRTVIRMTARGMLGRRRGVLMLVLPGVLLLIAALVRAFADPDVRLAEQLMSGFALATMVPLLGLIAGTGAIGPEIVEGSIVYLLAKPIPRSTVVISKVVVAIGCTAVFAALPVFLAGVILVGTEANLAFGFGVGALASSVAYGSLFVLLGVVSRHAVVFGLVYVLLWEGVLGDLVSGAQTLSVNQWGTTVASKLAENGVIKPEVSLPVSLSLLAAVTLAATWLAARRLRVLTLAGED
jgi:ABC-2 type transport system permease protein